MSVLNIHENLLEALLEIQAYSEVQVVILSRLPSGSLSILIHAVLNLLCKVFIQTCPRCCMNVCAERACFGPGGLGKLVRAREHGYKPMYLNNHLF